MLLLASSPRAKALIHQTHRNITHAIDSAIDDPVALRIKIKELQSEYPKRINEVTNDLGELQAQVSQVERELAISRRVVDLADADLSNLDHLLTLAENKRDGRAYGYVRIRYQDKVMSEGEAAGSARAIQQMRDVYSSRASELSQELFVLSDQESRLSELLAQLQTEQSEFQSQLWQLDRKVDAAARNERLIALMKKRQDRIDDHSRYDGISLDNLNRQLDGIRARQEAELARLTGTNAEQEYLRSAESQFNRSRRDTTEGFRFAPDTIELDAEVIELDQDYQDLGTPIARRGN
jgi:hypothetical protein